MLASPGPDDVLLDGRVAGLLPLPTDTSKDRAVVVGGTVELLLALDPDYVRRCGIIVVSGMRRNPAARIEFRPRERWQTDLLTSPVPVPGGGRVTPLVVLMHKVFTLTGFDYALWPQLVEVSAGDARQMAHAVAAGLTPGDETWLADLGGEAMTAVAALRGFDFPAITETPEHLGRPDERSRART